MTIMLDQFIRNPPAWIIAVIGAIIAAHVWRVISEILRGANGTAAGGILVIELLMVMVLAIICIHQYMIDEATFQGGDVAMWYNRPITLLGLFLVQSLVSLGILFRASR